MLPLDGDRSQVEPHEWIIGPLGQLFPEDPSIALELPLPERRIGVPRVPDDHVGPPHGHVVPPQGGQDLLVYPVSSPHILAERKQPDMIHGRLPAILVSLHPPFKPFRRNNERLGLPATSPRFDPDEPLHALIATILARS
jgi:hypothetical protein